MKKGSGRLGKPISIVGIPICFDLSNPSQFSSRSMARKFSFSDTSASPVRPISFIFLVVACLKGELVNGQHYGHGVGKNTHTTSNADQALRWYLRHLPTTQDNYAPCEEDEYCTCGTLGRVVCNTSHPNGDEENFSGSGKGFGIHTVELNDLSSRPSCNLTAAQIESIMTAKLASTPQGSYDSFMDFSTGFWVSNLDPYISAFSSTNGSTADDEGDEVLHLARARVAAFRLGQGSGLGSGSGRREGWAWGDEAWHGTEADS